MRALTGRLLLVPIGPEHIEDLYRLHQDPWVAYWYGGAWTREQTAAFASSCATAWRIDGVSKWVAYEKTTGSLVGRGGLSRLPASASSTQQIDALLADPGWRASRANRVIAFTEQHNQASRRVMEKLGLSLTGQIRAPGLVEGEAEMDDNAPFVVYATPQAS